MKRRYRVGFGKTIVLQVWDSTLFWHDGDRQYQPIGWRDARLEDLSEGEKPWFVS
jgi:hypothetical protein